MSMNTIDENYVLELRNIHKSFPGVKALDSVNLKVKPGSVHVICGENGAGKSTLMKVINGDYIPEIGEVIYKGQVLGKRTKMETIHMGIAMIQQEMHPVGSLSIAENIFLGREPERTKGVVDFKRMYRESQEIMDMLNVKYDVHTPMNKVSIACQQMAEIAKAITRNSSVIIMDEPTSSISSAEVEELFKQIERLKSQNVAIIYITHKMDEIFKIADEITVLRDGKWIQTAPVSEYDIDKLVTLMVGREMGLIFPKAEVDIGEVVLEVKGLTKKNGMYRNANFYIRKGEILGFAGLVGAGRSEVMRGIFGLDPVDEGEIFLEGRKLDIKNSKAAIANGIAMVVEDRRAEGIIGGRTVRENMTLVALNRICGLFQAVKSIQERNEVKKMIDTLSIKVSSMEQKISNLSGGNQQKVVLAKWMLVNNLKVLILDEPTRGIDVGAKAEIHKLMGELAKKGLAIIMISSELPEVLGMSDRIIVMKEGVIRGEISRNDATPESVMKLATK